MPRSLLNLNPRLRPLFFCAYLAMQLWLLVRAHYSPDLVFGFQMFNASSQLKISLFRKVRRRGRSRVVAIRDGFWETKDRSGATPRTVGTIESATLISARSINSSTPPMASMPSCFG